jgi:hypothetical protein
MNSQQRQIKIQSYGMMTKPKFSSTRKAVRSELPQSRKRKARKHSTVENRAHN